MSAPVNATFRSFCGAMTQIVQIIFGENRRVIELDADKPGSKSYPSFYNVLQVTTRYPVSNP